MPNVAASPADLIASLSRRRPRRRRTGSSSTTRRGSGARPRPTSPGPRRSRTDDPTAEAARWIVWEASQALGARSASIHDLYVARGRGEVSRVHRPGDQHPRPDVRHGAHVLRDGARAPTSAR